MRQVVLAGLCMLCAHCLRPFTRSPVEDIRRAHPFIVSEGSAIWESHGWFVCTGRSGPGYENANIR